MNQHRNAPECTQNHWRHEAANTAIEIDRIEIDVFQWRVASNSRESVRVDILNGNWEFSDFLNSNLATHSTFYLK